MKHTLRHNRAGVLTKRDDPLELKADAEQGLLSGYGSKWWVVDSYGECTQPGCFAKTVAERGPKGAGRIVHRYEHEHTVGIHTALDEDAEGLRLEAKVSDDGNWGSTLRAHLRDEIPYGLSIGFRYLAGRAATADDPLVWDHAPRWLRENPDPSMVYVLTEVKLLEVSSVSFPAVDPAQVDGYRSSLDVAQLEQLLSAVKAGTLSPEQRRLLTEIAAALPADGAPETGETPALPGATTDSTAERASERDELFTDLTFLILERVAA